MASEYDDADFVDPDLQPRVNASAAAEADVPRGSESRPQRPPSRADLEREVGQAHQKLEELKRAQQQLEQERASLEENRRRRVELQKGREELLQELTRGTALIEDAEFATRREAEQLGKTLVSLREAYRHVEDVREEQWTAENWTRELTRALTVLENARMEWNSARLKWPVLDGESDELENDGIAMETPGLHQLGFGTLCRVGFAMTWPIALAVLLGIGALIVSQ